MPYKQITLKENSSEEVFEYFKNRIINEFNAIEIDDIKNIDFRYFDFKIKSSNLTLHQENYLGISIFPTLLEDATLEDNNATEYYAMRLLSSENLYANFVTLKDASKIRIDILLDNILLVKMDNSNFEIKNSESKIKNFELCDVCDKSVAEYWESDNYSICKNCYEEFIINENYFEKLCKMKREEILEF